MLIKMLKETKRFGFSSCVVAKNIYNNICHCCLSSIQFALAHPQLRKAVLHRHRQQESQVSHGLLLVREVHHGKVTLSRHVTLLLWCPLVVVLASPNTSSATISRHALFVARSSSSWPVQTLRVQRIYYFRLVEQDVGVIRPCFLCCTFVVVLASPNASSATYLLHSSCRARRWRSQAMLSLLHVRRRLGQFKRFESGRAGPRHNHAMLSLLHAHRCLGQSKRLVSTRFVWQRKTPA